MHARAARLTYIAIATLFAATLVRAQQPPQATPPPPALTAAEARELLFSNAEPNSAADACARLPERDASVDCLLSERYASDPAAQRIALSLRRELNVVAGIETPHTMNGGFRGMIRIVGEAPVGPHRRHLEWVSRALRDFDQFAQGLARHAQRPLAYHPLPTALRFLRSVNRTTPSAYARDWRVSYNVSGSLLRNEASVRETLFHEIFHLNDEVHTSGTQRRWSARVLTRISDRILRRCGTNRRCLAPYAPSTTTVRGGTYYAFQPGNGGSVPEYAAELALRYYQEQRAALRHERFDRGAFKCGPPENAEAWRLLVDEFFGGADLISACP
ncbi:MAG: hypothetical protein IPK60_04295 [Sandaracinaceae bacterium]|nr:hypothetical protein [Sandaracinaceae bacterium]